MSAKTIEELGRLLKGVTLCFCTVCCHDRKYGHCYSCNCGNHVPEPIMPEAGKLKQALDHWREIAIGHFKEKFGAKETVTSAERQGAVSEERQSKNPAKPKVRFNGWLTPENYDFLCKMGMEEERSMANVLNRILSSMRQQDQSNGST